MDRLVRLERKVRDLTKEKWTAEKEIRFLDISGACAYLGISRTSLYTLMRTGALPFTLVGKQRRLIMADLTKYLETNYQANPDDNR